MEQITIVTKYLLLSCLCCAKDRPEKEKKRKLAPSDQTQYPPKEINRPSVILRSVVELEVTLERE